MANPWAGEIDLIVDGTTYPLKLTLGALAELEHRLEQPSLVALIKRFEQGRFSTADILHLLQAGMAGGGHRCPPERLKVAEIQGGPLEAARVAARLLARSFSLPVIDDPLPSTPSTQSEGDQV